MSNQSTPFNSARPSNEEVKVRFLSASIGGVEESAEFKKLLISLSSDLHYMENTGVTPLLIDALYHVDQIRPADPIEFLAAYILFNKGLYDGNPLYEHLSDDTSDLIDEDHPGDQEKNVDEGNKKKRC